MNTLTIEYTVNPDQTVVYSVFTERDEEFIEIGSGEATNLAQAQNIVKSIVERTLA